jgi:hypothetical protein
VHGIYYCVVHWNEGRYTCTRVCIGYVGMHICMGVYKIALGCMYGIVHSELHTCAALSSQRSTYSLSETGIKNEGRAFAESIAANLDIALVDLHGVHLSPYVDVLGVSNKPRYNRAILAHVQAQRIAQQRVKSAKGGTR